MNIPYIIHASILIALFYFLYRLLLHKETYFSLNRIILLAGIALAFALPFLPTPVKFNFNETIIETNTNLKATVNDLVTSQSQPNNSSVTNGQLSDQADKIIPEPLAHFTYQINILGAIYFTGVAILLINFLIQLANILLKIRKYKKSNSKIIELPNADSPYSFLGYTFISHHMVDDDLKADVLLHEAIHNQQKHSLDIVLAELLIIAQWFNPTAWLYRRSVESNIEYQTDAAVIQKDVEVKQYQYNLLQLAVPNFPLSIVNNYNQKLLKNRIIMMNTKKSSPSVTWKYLLYVPVMIMAIAIFNPSTLSGLSQYKNKDQKVVILISSNSTQEDLNRIKSELSKFGYTLYVEDVNWTDPNTLSNIDFKIFFNNESSISQTIKLNDTNRHETSIIYKTGIGTGGVAGEYIDNTRIIKTLDDSLELEYMVIASFLEKPMILNEFYESGLLEINNLLFQKEKTWSEAMYHDLLNNTSKHNYLINDKLVNVDYLTSALKYGEIVDIKVRPLDVDQLEYRIKINHQKGFNFITSNSVRMPKNDKLKHIDHTENMLQQRLKENGIEKAKYYFDGLGTDMTLQSLDTSLVEHISIVTGAIIDEDGSLINKEVRVIFKSIRD